MAAPGPQFQYGRSSKHDDIELGPAGLPISIDVHVEKTILHDGSTIDGIDLPGRPDNQAM
jgi:hypothetical protein